MDNTPLDSQEFEKDTSFRAIEFIGVGVFLYLTISKLGYLIAKILKGIFIAIGMNPGLNFWATKILTLTLTVFMIVFALRKIVRNYESKKRTSYNLLIYSVIAFAVTKFLQIVHSFLAPLIPRNIENYADYINFMKENTWFNMIDGVFGILTYILIGVIIVKERF